MDMSNGNGSQMGVTSQGKSYIFIYNFLFLSVLSVLIMAMTSIRLCVILIIIMH